MNFFYATICHACKERPDDLKYCSHCKSIAYCSKRHQEGDWRSHRKLCKAIAKTNRSVFHRAGCSEEEWKTYRLTLQAVWIFELRRSLEPHECHMWMFPRNCLVCHSRDVARDCENCLSVSYCGEDHERVASARHRKFCDGLRQILEINRYLWQRKSYPNFAFNDVGEGHSRLPDNIRFLADEQCEGNRTEFALKTDLLSPGATVIYGMEKAGLLPERRFGKRDLNIHMVGASSYEASLDLKATTELLLHWIKDVDRVKLTLIGPEAEPPDESFNETFCRRCKAGNKTAIVASHDKFYHEICDEIKKPDLVVAFNCGIHEFENDGAKDSWKNSLPWLLNHDAPLILTAYTDREIKADVARVEQACEDAFAVVKGRRNPFASRRPIRDCMLEERDLPFFFTNGYVAVLRKLSTNSN